MVHVLLSCYAATGFAVAGIHALLLRRDPSNRFYRSALALRALNELSKVPREPRRAREYFALTASMHLVDNFLRPLTIVEYTSADAASYAQVRARLERVGTPIGLDTLIAAQAVGRKLILVTNNQRELGWVPGLRLDSWGGTAR